VSGGLGSPSGDYAASCIGCAGGAGFAPAVRLPAPPTAGGGSAWLQPAQRRKQSAGLNRTWMIQVGTTEGVEAEGAGRAGAINLNSAAGFYRRQRSKRRERKLGPSVNSAMIHLQGESGI